MKRQGQTVIEYVLLIGIVTMALVYMGGDFKRGIQSAVKLTADQIGNQTNADQDFSEDSRTGLLTNSTSNTRQSQQKVIHQVNGVITPQEGQFSESVTKTYTNLSKTEN